MLRIKEYVKAASLEEAYELNQKRSNRVLGGMLWRDRYRIYYWSDGDAP